MKVPPNETDGLVLPKLLVDFTKEGLSELTLIRLENNVMNKVSID